MDGVNNSDISLESIRGSGMPCSNQTWTDTEFSEDNLSEITFYECTFTRCLFANVNLEKTQFVNCTLTRCKFKECFFNATNLTKVNADEMIFSGTKKSVELQPEGPDLLFTACTIDSLSIDQHFIGLTMVQSSFKRVAFNNMGTIQSRFTLSDSKVDKFSAENSQWDQSAFIKADIRNWQLENAKFDHCSMIEVNAAGKDFSSNTIIQTNFNQADLEGAKFFKVDRSIFAEANIQNAQFANGHFPGCFFNKAKGDGVNFAGSSIPGAMFPKASLIGADFSGCEAPKSVFNEAELTNANLENTNATRGSFLNAIMKDVNSQGLNLFQADLQGVKDDLDANTATARNSVGWREELDKASTRNATA